MAEVNLVQIHQQNIVLGIFIFQLNSQGGFLDFTVNILIPVIQNGGAGQLHGDGAGALGKVHFSQVHQQRAADTNNIHAMVFVKTGVLGGQQAVHQVFRDVVQRHVGAVFR